MFTTHKSQDAPGPAEGAHSAPRLLSWIWGGKEVGMAEERTGREGKKREKTGSEGKREKRWDERERR